MSEQLDGSGSISVKIHGRTYYLRGDGDGSYLKELASVVDEIEGMARPVADNIAAVASISANTMNVIINITGINCSNRRTMYTSMIVVSYSLNQM